MVGVSLISTLGALNARIRSAFAIGVPALVHIVVAEVGVQIGPVPKATLFFRELKIHLDLRTIPQAPFPEEVRPDQDVLLRKQTALHKTPLKNLLIASTLQRPLNKGLVVHAKKTKAPAVEALSKPWCIGRRQLSLSMYTDLVEHTRKPNHTAGGFAGTARQPKVIL